MIKGSDRYLRALRLADHALASTVALADDMAREVPGRGFVIENGIDSEARQLEASVRADPRPVSWPQVPPDGVLIAYGSGSRAHDDDLHLVANALATVMRADPRVHLLLLGPVRTPDALLPYRNRVVRVPQAPVGEYFRFLVSAHITIAPLRDTHFNRYKSHVKYLEAGLLGLPFVASPTVYEGYVRDGSTGFIAHADSQWTDRLTALIASVDLREQLGREAREHVEEWAIEGRPTAQFLSMLAALGVEVGVR